MSSPERLFADLMHMDAAQAYQWICKEINDLENDLLPEVSDDHIRFHYLFEMIRFMGFMSQAQEQRIQDLTLKLDSALRLLAQETMK